MPLKFELRNQNCKGIYRKSKKDIIWIFYRYDIDVIIKIQLYLYG